MILTGHDDVVGPWVAHKTGGVYSPVHSATIGITKAGKLVGGVIVDGYNGASCMIHVAGEGDWCSRHFLWFVFHYCFEQLGVRKVIGMVSSANDAALNFDFRLGFEHEGTIKDGARDGDILVLTMTAAQCRWLKFGGKHGKS